MYSGFTGTVYADPPNQTEAFFEGQYTVDKDTLLITELPPKRWTSVYKEWLLKAFATQLVKLDDLSDDERVRLELKFRPDFLGPIASDGSLVTRFDLKKRIHLNNMVLFDNDHNLVRYSSAEAIVADFVKNDLPIYERRIQAQLSELREQMAIAESENRFIEAKRIGRTLHQGHDGGSASPDPCVRGLLRSSQLRLSRQHGDRQADRRRTREAPARLGRQASGAGRPSRRLPLHASGFVISTRLRQP